MKIALCQLNPVTGDITGNTARIKEVISTTADQSPDLFVFPELYILGYPTLDLLENNWFIAKGLSALDDLCNFSRNYPGVGILTGIALTNHVPNGKGLFNSAVLITDGNILFHQNKSLLPTYDVFDESRYFDPAPEISLVEFKGEKLSITICEDAWNPLDLIENPKYDFDPVKVLVDKGASLLINISASPYYIGKNKRCFSLMQYHANKYGLPLINVNMIGANDELIFDGNSMFFNSDGHVCKMLPPFEEDVQIIDTTTSYPSLPEPEDDTTEDIYNALVLGVRDYTRKCGFKKAVIGLSGGIDSSVTCALAVEALGAENVLGILMPSQYSSKGSITDSEKLAKNLGIQIKTIPINSAFNSLKESLKPVFQEQKLDSTEENIQARIRGSVLMALSNKLGFLPLSTGNKSELAVGYCTLYGDMCGGLAVISDLYKTKVYELTHFINRKKDVIPKAIIKKTPSAELRPGQKDSDALGPYDTLDKILALLIEKSASVEEVIEEGFMPETVKWVAEAVANNEYKRRQAPPGLKITIKAFGSGRRFPIAARYDR